MGRPVQHSQIDTLAELWAYPKTPHPYDDEFDRDTLDAAWSETTTPTGSIDPYSSPATSTVRREVNGWRKSSYAVQPASGTTQFLYKPITFPTDCFAWTRMTFGYRYGGTSNDATMTMEFYADAGGGTLDSNNKLAMFLQESDSSLQIQIDRTQGGSNSVLRTTANQGATGQAQLFEYAGIQKLGSSYHLWAFTGNGQMFHMLETTLSFTPALVAFRFGNTSSAAPGASIMTLDFFRFKESAVFLPGYGD